MSRSLWVLFLCVDYSQGVPKTGCMDCLVHKWIMFWHGIGSSIWAWHTHRTPRCRIIEYHENDENTKKKEKKKMLRCFSANLARWGQTGKPKDGYSREAKKCPPSWLQVSIVAAWSWRLDSCNCQQGPGWTKMGGKISSGHNPKGIAEWPRVLEHNRHAKIWEEVRTRFSKGKPMCFCRKREGVGRVWDALGDSVGSRANGRAPSPPGFLLPPSRQLCWKVPSTISKPSAPGFSEPPSRSLRFRYRDGPTSSSPVLSCIPCISQAFLFTVGAW